MGFFSDKSPKADPATQKAVDRHLRSSDGPCRVHATTTWSRNTGQTLKESANCDKHGRVR